MTAPQKRIALAFIFGMVLITSAFVLSKKTVDLSASRASLASAAKREFIAVKDDDQDGIPNWQDSLLTENPINLDTTVSATYTPPTTVTGKVAVNFFKNFVSAKKYGVFGDTNTEIVDKATTQLLKESADTVFVSSDIKTLPDFDATTLRLYGDEVASILLVPTSNEKSEIEIFQDALQYNTPESLAQLDPIIMAYGTMITSLATINVPLSYVPHHVSLLNSLNAVHEDIIAMSKVDDDALYTFTRVKRYQDDVTELHKAILTLFDTLYTKDNIRWSEGEEALKLMKF